MYLAKVTAAAERCWVVMGFTEAVKCDLEPTKTRASRKAFLLPTNVLGSCSCLESGNLLELSSSIREWSAEMIKSFCLACGVCVDYASAQYANRETANLYWVLHVEVAGLS